MNAITVILLALAIHSGGVDVDTARDVELHWYDQGHPRGTWTMTGREEGLYRFSGTAGELDIRRLPERDLTYAVTGSDTEGARPFLGILTLPVEGNISAVRREDVLVAFTRPAPSAADSVGNAGAGDAGQMTAAAPTGTAGNGESAPQPRAGMGGDEGSATSDAASPGITVRNARGLVTTGDSGSGQIVVLRFF